VAFRPQKWHKKWHRKITRLTGLGPGGVYFLEIDAQDFVI
jgi:hypothetical protein